jgi:hypothetical protein
VYGDDSAVAPIPVPQGFKTQPAVACLESIAAITVAQSASVFAVVTDADGWVGGTKINNPLPAGGGFTINEVAGTVTVPRAMLVRIKYALSGFTVVVGTRTAAVFGGATNATRLGGTSFGSEVAGSPATLVGEVVASVAAGDILSIKTIESTAGSMVIAATGATFCVEEI